MTAEEFNECIDKIRSENNQVRKDTLELIYNAYSKLMYFIAIGIVKNSDDANDIMQDFFRYILENARSIGHKKDPSAWITISIRNNAIRYKKKKSKTTLIENAEDFFLHEPDLDWAILIEDCKKDLNDIERKIFELHFYQGYTYKEISIILNRPYGTIQRDFHKIRAKMLPLEKYFLRKR